MSNKHRLVLATLFLGSLVAVNIASALISQSSATINSRYATPGGTFAEGWQWTFQFTVPSDETKLRMKFDNFTNGSDSIAVANNLRIYSPQSASNTDGASALTVSATDTYTTAMDLAGDLDSEAADRQIVVVVQAQVPSSSAGGPYTLNYTVNTELPPDTTPPVITQNGSETLTLNVGDAFSDPGATAADDRDGNITANIVVGGDTVSTSGAGVFVVTYNVSDAAGNVAIEKTLTVTVVDSEPPPPPPPL